MRRQPVEFPIGDTGSRDHPRRTVEVRTRSARTLAATAPALVAFTGTADATPYTKEFRGEGSSGFGFAWEYARADAARQARNDGFTEPTAQCEETYARGNVFDARVLWECTR